MSIQQLILIEDVEGLGLAGDEVKVAPGYARNYLLPNNKAIKASPGALRLVAARKEKIEQQRQDELQRAKDTAAKIAATDITISMQASEDDQLFGSVTDRIISDAFKEQNIDVDHNRVDLKEPLKELGMFNVEIHLHPDVTASAKVWVVRA